jgi:hypothetical protein
MSLTDDPDDPRIQRGPIGGETERRPQNDVYLVMSDKDLAAGYLKPYREAYKHQTCGYTTTMGHKLSATYAADPWFYGLTYCCNCQVHRPLDEFTWLDGESMSPAQWPAVEIQRIVELRAKRGTTPAEEAAP